MNTFQEDRKGQDPRTLENTKPTELGLADGYPPMGFCLKRPKLSRNISSNLGILQAQRALRGTGPKNLTKHETLDLESADGRRQLRKQ